MRKFSDTEPVDSDQRSNSYKSYWIDQALTLGAKKSLVKTEMTDALNFAESLVNVRKLFHYLVRFPKSFLFQISLAEDDRKDIRKFHIMRTIAQLQKEFPYNIWLNYFRSLLPLEVFIDENESIVVGDYEFFTKLGNLLQQTPKRTLANYIGWKETAQSLNYLPKTFKEREFAYVKKSLGLGSTSRWKFCVSEVLERFPLTLSSFYIRKHFHEDDRNEALKMVKSIKSEFKMMLENNAWMDKETKAEAIVKLEALREVVGYPEGLFDEANVARESLFFDSNFNESFYFESVFAMIANERRELRMKLRTPVTRSERLSYINPASVIAAYSSWDHSVHIPAGVLQSVFFNMDRPGYMNYGAIGLIIGHEITHGRICNQISEKILLKFTF